MYVFTLAENVERTQKQTSPKRLHKTHDFGVTARKTDVPVQRPAPRSDRTFGNRSKNTD